MANIIFYEGYRYYIHKSTRFKKFLRCDHFKLECKGWAIMSLDGSIKLTREHNHPEYSKAIQSYYLYKQLNKIII